VKFYLMICTVLLSQIGFASNQTFDPKCIGCFSFVAPSVVGAENITSPVVGLIVYDTFYSEFRGYKADGTWTKFWSGQNFVRSVAANVTLTSSDDVVIADASSAAFTITLPDADLNEGKQFVIKKSPQDATFNLITIQPAAGETIDDAASKHLATTNESIILVSDGADWNIASRTIPSDWVSYTPTGGWTGGNVTYTGKWRRVGSDMELDLKVALTGAPTGTTLTFDLPSGCTIDTAKLVDGIATEGIGIGMAFDYGVQNYPIFAKVLDTNTVFAAAYGAAATYATFANVQHNIPLTFGNADYATLKVKIPISGWEG